MNTEQVNFVQGIPELMEVYGEIDARIAVFKKEVGFDCPEFCGQCCERSLENIEASIFEMIPFSIYLWETGKIQIFFEGPVDQKDEQPCPLLGGNDQNPSKGRCWAYSYRPLICRLFGFSAVHDKHGKPRVSLCRNIKQKSPGIEEKVQRMVAEGLPVPLYSQFVWRVCLINPFYGTRLYPIHAAVQKAVEAVGVRMKLLSPDLFDGEACSHRN